MTPHAALPRLFEEIYRYRWCKPKLSCTPPTTADDMVPSEMQFFHLSTWHQLRTAQIHQALQDKHTQQSLFLFQVVITLKRMHTHKFFHCLLRKMIWSNGAHAALGQAGRPPCPLKCVRSNGLADLRKWCISLAFVHTTGFFFTATSRSVVSDFCLSAVDSLRFFVLKARSLLVCQFFAGHVRSPLFCNFREIPHSLRFAPLLAPRLSWRP